MKENPNNPEPTLRDIFAGMAMMAILANTNHDCPAYEEMPEAARDYYKMADAMLKVRDE